MSKKMTATKVKMAALGLNMKEIGEEIYIDPPKEEKLKQKNLKK